MVSVVVVVGEGEVVVSLGGDGGAGAGVYLTGDSLERKSRRLGSRSRRGSRSEDPEDPQSQPMVGWGWWSNWLLGVEEGSRVECQGIGQKM